MVQEVDLQKMDTAQDVLLATPCPKETTLYGTNKVRWRYTSLEAIQQKVGPRADRSPLSPQTSV